MVCCRPLADTRAHGGVHAPRHHHRPHTCTQTGRCACSSGITSARAYTHTYTHTHTHADTYAHIHTHTRTALCVAAGITNANMALVTVDVDVDAAENAAVAPQLEDGEFIETMLVPYDNLYSHLLDIKVTCSTAHVLRCGHD